jgi:aspartyl-tRNA(Asn)/glutamyl-tRNA(Gln) amidotransferase subunit A
VRYNFLLGRYVLAEDYIKGLQARRLIAEELDRVLGAVDVFVSPTVPVPAYPIGATATTIRGESVSLIPPMASQLIPRNTRPFNLAGLPAISIPCGLTSEGLPVGLQLATTRGRDRDLLAIASAVEEALGIDAVAPAVTG